MYAFLTRETLLLSIQGIKYNTPWLTIRTSQNRLIILFYYLMYSHALWQPRMALCASHNLGRLIFPHQDLNFVGVIQSHKRFARAA
jgi:hypothetical protein